MSARHDARADDGYFAAGERAPSPLPIAIGDEVIANGQRGVVEAVAFSVATERRLVTVAFGPRMRFTFHETELIRT